MTVLQTGALPLGYVAVFNYVEQAPRVGLEPTTPRLTAVCSTIELSRNNRKDITYRSILIICTTIYTIFYAYSQVFIPGTLKTIYQKFSKQTTRPFG